MQNHDTDPVLVTINHDRVMSESLDGETIVIDTLTGAYYTFDGHGSALWDCVAAGTSRIDDLAEWLARSDQVAPVSSRSVVERFVRQLFEFDLVALSRHLPPAAQDSEASDARPIVITRYSDLEELILLDPIHEVDPDQGWPARHRA